MTKTDRRVQRTREQLQQALIDLMHERDFATLTIQDIVDRANVGRTTFYLHFESKDDLLISCHEAMVSAFHFGPLYPLSREDLLAPLAPAGMTSAYQHLADVQGIVVSIFQGKESGVMLQRLRDWSAAEIETSLRAAFPDEQSAIPLELLANYLAGAQIALLHWWFEKSGSHPPEAVVQTVHRLQRAAICDAFGLRAGS